jgi:hypothetical protein
MCLASLLPNVDAAISATFALENSSFSAASRAVLSKVSLEGLTANANPLSELKSLAHAKEATAKEVLRKRFFNKKERMKNSQKNDIL